MKIGIVIICTNIYFILALRFIKHFVKFYGGDLNEIIFYLFTDTDPKPFLPNMTNIVYKSQKNSSWIGSTNSRYKNILSLSNELIDYIYFIDADTDAQKPFTKESFIGDLVGLEHFSNKEYIDKPYNRNPKSKAYIPPLDKDDKKIETYYHGSFFGGTKNNVIAMSKILYEYQNIDKQIPYEPRWNDESYLNRYFYDNPPSRTIPIEEYMFAVSDKGGLQNTRNTTLDISNLKDMILKNPTAAFKLVDGIPSFIDDGGKRRRTIKKRRRLKSKRKST